MMTSRMFLVLNIASKGSRMSMLRLSQDKIQMRCLSNVTTPSTRRRRSVDPNVKSADPNITEIPKEQDIEEEWHIDFDGEVFKLLSQVNDAVIPMIKLNPGFSVLFEPNEQHLTIQTAKGKLSLRTEKESGLIHLQSFLSGSQHYYFDGEVRTWVSKRDQHNLRGIITRDLIRHNRGCPDLDEKP